MGKGARNRKIRKDNEPSRDVKRQIAKIVRAETNKQLAEAADRFYGNETSIILYVLYEALGCRGARLQKFMDMYVPLCEELKNYYIMSEEDVPFLCMRKLQEVGIDIAELEKHAQMKMKEQKTDAKSDTRIQE